MTTFIVSFSASRLKGFRFPLALSFSFFLSFEPPKKEPDPDEDLVCAWLKDSAAVGGALDELAACRAALAASSCSSSTKGFSSVSLRTLDLS
jgi:hypothetical protein